MAECEFKTVWICASEADLPIWHDLQQEIRRLRLPAALKSYVRVKNNIPFKLLNFDQSVYKFHHNDLMIVLCSKTASADAAVNLAVGDFRKYSDNILAVLLNGEPNASQKNDTANECFPPALSSPSNEETLTTFEPIAADIRQGMNTLALQKLCAGLLSVPLRDITQRAHLQKRSLQIAIAVLASIALVRCTHDGLSSINQIEDHYQNLFDQGNE
ncbi:hypothetical protein GTH32_00660 [Alteromonas sp. 345S023]|uniref:Uncharacterized protein n=1 Tax=Alteromonas profundi TaxID=2696062 RepID=A0A7X5LHZ0_9ALTE|nr:hypothetical protein [Alteromonas profundi]NDV89707.1 hypothetical protein [Alteromonas profundi]